MTYLFIGGELALDLVNTEVVARGRPADLLASAGNLRRWWEEARRHHPSAGLAPLALEVPAAGAIAAEGDTRLGAARLGAKDRPETVGRDDAGAALLAATKALRAALRRLFETLARGAAPASADVEAVNAVMRVAYPALAIDSDSAPRADYGVREDGPDATLLPIALSARDLLAGRDLRRLRRCGNRRCVLLFYDGTKSATRRWCSVRCMDRARSSARYAERKAGGTL